MTAQILYVGNPTDATFLPKLQQVSEGTAIIHAISENSQLAGYFDIIVLDATEVTEPYALIQRLRAEHPYARILFTSAAPTWRRVREALTSGADDFISRYISLPNLQMLLNGWLNRTP
jgi:DNA-binding response OmpR family regulator